jgi:hypothetical protein
LVSSTGACTALTGSRAFYAHIDFTPGGPSPSASVSPSASPVPSGSPTVSPMPPSSPSPTPGPVAAWPDASNTGVPPGTVLTAVNGDVTVTVANTTIDAKDIHGCVEVRAPGVTLKRSKVHCMSVAVASFDGVYTGTPLTIEDSEIDCLNSGGTAVGDTNVTARRLNVHGCENGFDIDANVTVQDSYIHDLYNSAQAHTDGIQLASGHFVNGALVPAAANVTVVHQRHDLQFRRGHEHPDPEQPDGRRRLHLVLRAGHHRNQLPRVGQPHLAAVLPDRRRLRPVDGLH